jgi:uncharacterized membrane protein
MTTCLPPLASLRFEGIGHPWLWIVLVLAGAALLLTTYLGIFQRSERRLTWLLLLLRGAGILALLLALAKPVWTRQNDLVDAGRVAIILDNSVSMSLPDPSGKSRYALATDTAERLKKALEADRSRGRMEVDLFDINGTDLRGQVPDQPTVERTDLGRAIGETTTRLRSRPLAGLVLISDGMDNTGRQDFRELGDLPAPVHAIGFRADADSEHFDLAMRKARAVPERALVNNEIKVETLVTKTGGPATEATVVVKRGREQFASKKISFGPGNGEQHVTLHFTPTQAGSFVFTATVEGATGERVLSNNSQHFALRVDAEPIRVLYLEGFLRYEYKFLKNRLEDDPDVSLVTVVRRANPDRIQPRPNKDLLTPERLKQLDVVILGDMEASYLSGPEYQALVRWLDEKNHALLVLGGYHSFGPDGFRATPLAEVLPVVFAEKPPYQAEDPFTIQLTEEGRRHPAFELTGDRVKDAAAWSGTPPLLGSSVVQRAKPGAVTLAVNPSFVIDGKSAVVAATQRYGAGHTMVLTADTTWRWSRLTRVMGQSDTLYARFWSQTLRWLAGRSLDDQRPLLVVSTDRPSYDVGKAVAVRVARQPKPGVDLAASEVGAEVTGPDGKAVPVQLRAASAEPDVFTGTFYPPAGGRYELAATLTAGGKPLANQAAEFLVHGSDLELADPGTNRANLQAIAAATGGVYLDVEDADQLLDKIARKERRITRVQRSEFWNSPLLFVFFLGAVTVEWLVRRRNHLV